MSVRRLSEFRGSLVRAVSVSILALAAAACSGDSNRFAQTNPFGNPFASSRVDMTPTGSIPNQTTSTTASPAAISAPRVAAAPLPPPTAPIGNPNIINRAGAGVNAPVTGYKADGWTAAGGSPVVLAQGETVNALANRYGVPAEAIYRTNGLASGSAVAPGTRLTIPVYRPGQTTAEAARHAAPPKPPAPPKPEARHADARHADARQPAKHADAKPAAKHAETARTKAAESHQPVKQAEKPKTVAAKPEAVKPVKAKQTAAGNDDQPAKANPKTAAKQSAAAETKIARTEKTEPETTGSLPSGASFRWPARGRIISGFKNNGNEGINIAVPEGTPVKAAEEGTVAYAGSELKGYGNLVLVRHANGYVSAYAHNGELKVKKGDVVKRGQTIATAGQTGNVSSPQLHFEIRKGATPVDPTTYLQ